MVMATKRHPDKLSPGNAWLCGKEELAHPSTALLPRSAAQERGARPWKISSVQAVGAPTLNSSEESPRAHGKAPGRPPRP